jgi:hypothetical protein
VCPIAGWYPYPFVDTANGGYASVALCCVGILLFMTAVCAGVVAAERRWATAIADR